MQKKIGLDTAKKLYKVNDLRKYFSHPLTYHKKIRELEDPEKYLAALRILEDAYEDFNKMFAIKRALEIVKKEKGKDR